MNAEFILLVYHQLICHSDSDEIQERLSMEQQIDRGWDSTTKPSNSKVEAYTDHYGRERITEVPATMPAVNPRDNRPPDTEKTIYRWNHVTDSDWHTWGINGRKNWIDTMIKKYGKSVVA